MPYSSSNAYNWLDVASDVTGVLSKFPHRIKEASELDRRIQNNELEVATVEEAFTEWSKRLSTSVDGDTSVAQQLAANLNMGDGWTTSQLNERIMQGFPPAQEGENAGAYSNRMAHSFQEFVDTAGIGMDRDTFTSIMMNPVTGNASGSSVQHTADLKDSENVKQFETVALGTEDGASIQEQMGAYETAGKGTGIDYTKDQRYKDLQIDSYSQQAGALLRDKANIKEINDTGLVGLTNQLLEEGVPQETIDIMFRQQNQQVTYDARIQAASDATTRAETAQVVAELNSARFAEQKRLNTQQAERDASEGREISVNLVNDSISELIIKERANVARYAPDGDEPSVESHKLSKDMLGRYEKALVSSEENSGLFLTPSAVIKATITAPYVFQSLTVRARNENYSSEDVKSEIDGTTGYNVVGEETDAQGNVKFMFLDDLSNSYWWYNTATDGISAADDSEKNRILNTNDYQQTGGVVLNPLGGELTRQEMYPAGSFPTDTPTTKPPATDFGSLN